MSVVLGLGERWRNTWLYDDIAERGKERRGEMSKKYGGARALANTTSLPTKQFCIFKLIFLCINVPHHFAEDVSFSFTIIIISLPKEKRQQERRQTEVCLTRKRNVQHPIVHRLDSRKIVFLYTETTNSFFL